MDYIYTLQKSHLFLLTIFIFSLFFAGFFVAAVCIYSTISILNISYYARIKKYLHANADVATMPLCMLSGCMYVDCTSDESCHLKLSEETAVVYHYEGGERLVDYHYAYTDRPILVYCKAWLAYQFKIPSTFLLIS